MSVGDRNFYKLILNGLTMESNPANFLTIAIPTYKRPGEISKRLAELTPQLREGVEIRIFENGETLETREAVNPFLSPKVHYSPSKYNRGMFLNMLRCFEETDSPWVWVLGDDDRVLPESVEKLCGWLEASEDSLMVSYRSNHPGNGEKHDVLGVDEFFSHMSFSEALFIGSTIWKREEAIKRSGLYFDSGYSMGPHFVVILSILGEMNGHASIYSDSLIEPKLTEHRWSRLDYMRRSLTFFDFIEDRHAKIALARNTWGIWKWSVYDALKQVDSLQKLKIWYSSMRLGQKTYRPYVGFTRTFAAPIYAIAKHSLRPLWLKYKSRREN